MGPRLLGLYASGLLRSLLLHCLASNAHAAVWPQGRQQESLSAFAEDVYYCSLEYGPEDPRTSLGFYNMGKVTGVVAQGWHVCDIACAR